MPNLVLPSSVGRDPVRASRPAALLRAAVLAFGGLAFAAPAYALDTSLDNVTIDLGDKGKIELKHIEFTDTNLTQEEVGKLFSAGLSLADRTALIAKLKATKISIPEVVFTDKDGKFTLKDLVATNVDSGKVEHAGIASIDGAGQGGEQGATLKCGAIAMDGAQFASLLATPARGSFLFTHFSVTGVELAVADKATPATAPGGNLYKMSLASLVADETYANDVPLTSKMTISGLNVEVPPGSEAGKQLAAFGYSKFEMGLTYLTTYDPAKGTFSFDDDTLTIAGVGVLSLKGQLGAVDPAAFAGTEAEKMGALAKANVSSVEINFTNSGIVEKGLAFAAQQQGTTPDALKAQVAAMAMQMVPAMLQGVPNAPKIGEALSAFVNAPTSLTISAKAKSGAIAFTEIAGLDNPMALLAKLDLDVRSGAPGTTPAPAPAPGQVATAPQPAPTPAPVPPMTTTQRLNGVAAWNALVGNTLSGKDSDGDALVLYFLKDGTVKQLAGDETSSGKWVLKGDQVCFTFPDDDEESCYKVVLEGKVATLTDSDDEALTFELQAGNPQKF